MATKKSKSKAKRGAKSTAARRATRTSSPAPTTRQAARKTSRGPARDEPETGTFGGEACRECGAPYEVQRGPRSYENRAAREVQADEDTSPRGPDEREPGLGDVERPVEPSRRGSGSPREPRGTEVPDPRAGEGKEGPSERTGAFGPRGR
jgi:hypothetical protein